MKKNILREDAEMKEMGIKASRLAKLQPQNYLVKRVSRIGKEQKSKLKYLPYQEIFLEAIEEIKNLNWQDLIIDDAKKDYYYIDFPKSIDRKLKQSLKVINIKYRKDLLDNRFKLFLNMAEDNRLYDIYLFTEEDRNRTHFPDGLPGWLLGLNLGIKLYRALLYYLDFIQSTETASYDVQKIYHNLVQMPDVNCVILKNNTLLIDSSTDRQKKAMIVGEFIFELFKIGRKRKLELGTDMIVDSALSKELGTNNIKKLIEELRVLARKSSDRKPFSPDTFGDFSIPQKDDNYLKSKKNDDVPEEDDESDESCDYCGGEGRVECSSCSGDDECSDCDSTGYVDCPECDGSGLKHN